MSNKINVFKIIAGHIDTLKESGGGISFLDIMTFFILPLALAGVSLFCGISIDKDLNALLVNFGAIFTALLLSVLVLVYDQEAKLQQQNSTADQNSSNPQGNTTLQSGSMTNWVIDSKRKLLKELYFNICFAVIVSLVLVLVCFLHSIAGLSNESISRFFTTPLAIYLTANLFLTIFMVVKRMHVLLTVQ